MGLVGLSLWCAFVVGAVMLVFHDTAAEDNCVQALTFRLIRHLLCQRTDHWSANHPCLEKLFDIEFYHLFRYPSFRFFTAPYNTALCALRPFS